MGRSGGGRADQAPIRIGVGVQSAGRCRRLRSRERILLAGSRNLRLRRERLRHHDAECGRLSRALRRLQREHAARERAVSTGSSTDRSWAWHFAGSIESPRGRWGFRLRIGGVYLKELLEYPPQFKIKFMSNNPPIYDIGPEAKMGMKAWLKEHGFGRLTPWSPGKRSYSPRGCAGLVVWSRSVSMRGRMRIGLGTLVLMVSLSVCASRRARRRSRSPIPPQITTPDSVDTESRHAQV